MNKNKSFNRRSFLTRTTLAGFGFFTIPMLNASNQFSSNGRKIASKKKRVGIIGLDTSHSEIFTKIINSGELSGDYKVVAACSEGSTNIPAALKYRPGVTKALSEMGVKIVDSIETLLGMVDFVLLETIDGRPHYEQAIPVLKAGKPMFIDKPMAANLNDVKKIFAAAKDYNCPIFGSSALRFDQKVQKVVNGSIGKVTGADVYTPAIIEEHHLDLAWYGIHGVEMLFTIMGPGCTSVQRIYEPDTDIVIGIWNDGRIGTIRGIRKGARRIAGTAFGEKGISELGPFSTYIPLLEQVIKFFDSGIPPVSELETVEIFKFMEGADLSRKRNGKRINLID